MKFGFGTIGLPPWPIAELATRASEFGYDEVSLRCAPPDREMLPSERVSVRMSDAELDAIKQVFNEAGVEILTLSTFSGRGGFLRFDSDKIDWKAETADMAAYARVAERLGCQYVRFLVEQFETSLIEQFETNSGPALNLIPEWDWDEYLDELGRASLAAIKGTNLTAVLQNHYGSASATQLFQMIERIGDSRLGVVFCPDHCIVMQEDPIQMAVDHGDYIVNVCVADRRAVKEDEGKFDGRYYYVRYEGCAIGEGLVPFKRLFETLIRKGWDGCVSTKWERRNSQRDLESFIPFIKSLTM